MSEDRRQSSRCTYEVLSRIRSSRRPRDLTQKEPRAFTVQEVRSSHSPFANPRFKETNHILYPDKPFSSSESQASEPEATTPLSRLRQSIREGWKARQPRRENFRRQFRAFFVEGRLGDDGGDPWLESLDGMEVDIESSQEGDWTVIDCVEDEEDENYDDYIPLDLSTTDLQPPTGFRLDIPFADVRKGRKIGEGAFGQVYQAVYKNRAVVLKEVAPHHYQTGMGQKFIDSLMSELIVLGTLGNHPNVLECYGGSVKSPHVFMLCQKMEMTLADLLYCQPDGPAPLNLDLALHIAHDVLAGLNHLHSRSPKIVHRDIKPENILLDKRNHACVADFGLSRTKSHTYINTENTHAGTAEYLAPEVAKGKMNEKMDVYAAGVILWECMTGERPWEGYHPFAIFLNVSEGQRLPFPENIFPSQQAGEENVMIRVRNVIDRCWIQNPEDRPSCAEIMDDIEDIFLEMYNYGRS